MSPASARTDSLVDRFLELAESPENRRRIELQQRMNRREKVIGFNPWQWSGGLSLPDSATPVPGASIRELAQAEHPTEERVTRMIVDSQIERQLRAFSSSVSDVPVALQIFTNLGLTWLYRLGAFSERHTVHAGTGAFVTTPLLESSSEWKQLPSPTFPTSTGRHAPRVEAFRSLTRGNLPVIDDHAPHPIGTVFGTVSRIRGDTGILLDFRLCPEDAHGLLRFVADSARRYNAAWLDHAGRHGEARDDAEPYVQYIFASHCAIGGVPMMVEGEDHVSAAVFSENDFCEFVLPYEREVMAGYPRCYYHSCGNLTPFFRHIRTLPSLHRLHVSPWSSLETAVEVFGNEVILEIHQPLDFDRLSSVDLDRRADRIIDLCAGSCTIDLVVPDTENGRRFQNRIRTRTASHPRGAP